VDELGELNGTGEIVRLTGMLNEHQQVPVHALFCGGYFFIG
jgi:hypothetical protein